MSQGKFSQPRPHREEEREIEKAYRDLTRKQTRRPQEHTVTEADRILAAQPLPSEMPPEGNGSSEPAESAAEEQQMEDAFRQLTGQPVSHRPAPDPEFGEFQGEEPEKPERPQWMTQVLEFYHQNTKLVLAALCALALMLIILVISLFVRSAGDPYGSKILSNVYIANVNVGGMTRKEAVAALNDAFGDSYSTEDMVIDLSGTELRLTPGDTGASLDADAAVEEAYAYGRTGTQEERDAACKASKTEPHNIAILPYLNLKTENIRAFLTDKAGNSDGTLVQTRYGLEGAEPELSADKFDKNAPCQTLVITMGKPGVGFDPEEVYNQVLDAFSMHVFLVTVEDVETLKDPDPIDLEKIYKEFYIEPVNAAINPSTGKTTPGSYGYGFDLEEARKLVDAADFGEEIRIPMEYIEPDILDADSFFTDTLGEYQTRATSSESRTNNLRLACQAIDGTVLDPGESLSFQNAIGQLTTGRGYKSASEDFGMESTVGGGVAQVASTLYCAALLSDVTVTSRSNLELIPSYIGSGLDADTTLKLKNETGYPIRVNAQVSGGYVRISISGTETRDYYRMLGSEVVKTYPAEKEYVDYPYQNAQGYRDGDVIEEGRDGYQVKSYCVRYSRATDQKITSDYVATSNYASVRQVLARVEKPEETTVPEETEETEETQATEETQESTESDDSYDDQAA
ncbi:MAG: VanW family protein [Faecousia sp.]